ncbi:MAG TPA: dTDP-4-dehydrorhamnose reductase [Polyangiales bacterium]|jgi:dTDP-4-dehydrorhamnose reductase|nr:dTDP-4-dehydrorhamnose reductase [Polyangiales bacterium]
MATAQPFFIVSPDGMLGRAWQALLAARGIESAGGSFPDLDLRDVSSIAHFIEPKYRVVINCAAYTDVDRAERFESDAEEVNATGLANLAARCHETGALLVHYSTDYVFDGAASSPYPVDAPRRPQTAYGRTKARGEELLESSGSAFLMVRTSWLYAPWGKNFVDTIAKFGAERPELRVVDDQHGRPTSAQYLAERSLALIEKDARGTFHVTDGGQCTWFEFAKAIVAATGGSARVDPCTTAEFARPAVRPPYSVLDLSRTDALIGPSRDWRENLADVLAARRAAQSG